jgi:hypothetical protein
MGLQRNTKHESNTNISIEQGFIAGLYAVNHTRHQHLSQQLLALFKNSFNFYLHKKNFELLHT